MVNTSVPSHKNLSAYPCAKGCPQRSPIKHTSAITHEVEKITLVLVLASAFRIGTLLLTRGTKRSNPIELFLEGGTQQETLSEVRTSVARVHDKLSLSRARSSNFRRVWASASYQLEVLSNLAQSRIRSCPEPYAILYAMLPEVICNFV